MNTVRFAHLKGRPTLKVGDKIKSGDLIGIMGGTGGAKEGVKHYVPHLHIDCVKGLHDRPWQLKDIEQGYIKSDPRQLNYFIDNDLFNFDYEITTNYACPLYMAKYDKVHYAYDIVPMDRHKTEDHKNIFWNRTRSGEVISVGYNSGYGYYIHIAF